MPGCAMRGTVRGVAHGPAVADAHLAVLAETLFPAIAAVQASAERLAALRATPAAMTMLAARRARLAACGDAPECAIRAALWSPDEQETLARAIAAPGDDDAHAALLRELHGLNDILQVYGLSATPRYPLIDGPGDPPDPTRRTARLAATLTLARADADDPASTIDPAIALALALLDAADRDDAARYRPLDATENRAAMRRARHVDWRRYRYTAIIVPGIGPETLDLPLSPLGKLNVRMAAARYAQGLAPFVILSGAAVHPRGTRAVEAIEMRRALIARFGIPADAILIDPHARHTTTNLRNAGRLLFAMRAPATRDALIVTNAGQSAYIESPAFAERNAAQLGYQPGTVGARLSPNDLTFRPSPASLRVDPADPLDP
jgi:hypothetical protein